MIPITLEEQCLEYGQILGCKGPVPEAALKAALQHEAYARELLLNSDSPQMLSWLLGHPPVIPQERAYSNYKLVGKAATAFFKWRKMQIRSGRPAMREHRQRASELVA